MIRTLLLTLAAGCLLYEGLKVRPSLLLPSLDPFESISFDRAHAETLPNASTLLREQYYESSPTNTPSTDSKPSSSSSSVTEASSKPTFPPPVFKADVEKRDAVREAFVVSLQAPLPSTRSVATIHGSQRFGSLESRGWSWEELRELEGWRRAVSSWTRRSKADLLFNLSSALLARIRTRCFRRRRLPSHLSSRRQHFGIRKHRGSFVSFFLSSSTPPAHLSSFASSTPLSTLWTPCSSWI